MKKIFFAILLLFGFIQSNAQVTFRPGIRAGSNFSKITDADSNFKPDLFVGIYGALKLSRYYVFQPEISYSNQGGNNVSSYEFDQINQKYVVKKVDISNTFVTFGIINKFYINENINVNIGSTLDFMVDPDEYTDSEVDLAISLGAGYKIAKNLEAEIRVKKGIVDTFMANHSYGLNQTNTNFLFQLGLSYTFDFKN